MINRILIKKLSKVGLKEYIPILTAELEGKFSHCIVTELPEAIVNPDR